MASEELFNAFIDSKYVTGPPLTWPSTCLRRLASIDTAASTFSTSGPAVVALQEAAQVCSGAWTAVVCD